MEQGSPLMDEAKRGVCSIIWDKDITTIKGGIINGNRNCRED